MGEDTFALPNVASFARIATRPSAAPLCLHDTSLLQDGARGQPDRGPDDPRPPRMPPPTIRLMVPDSKGVCGEVR